MGRTKKESMRSAAPRVFRARLIGGAAVLICFVALPASAANDKVGAAVKAALSGASSVRVVVALEETSAGALGSLGAARSQARAKQDRVLTSLARHDYQLVHRFDYVPGLVLKVDQAGLAALAAHVDVMRIDLDVGGSGSLASSVPMINADDLHMQGITGAAVTVAFLDSGLDTDHDDLSDNLVHQDCFLDEDGTLDGVGDCPNGSDRQTGAGAAEDGHGHGTKTTGIVTSKGTVSSVGVAPDADIVAIKVLDNSGVAGTFAFFSEIVAALDHLISSHPEVKVINMSLGTSALFTGACDSSTAYNILGAAAVNTLRASGVIAFASSGNDGSGTSMTSPACLSNVVSVGAADEADAVASFTNSNSTTNIMGPGVSITSTGLANGTSTGNGTSYASPHAAGCAALFIQAGTFTTPDEIEQRLESSKILVTDATNGLTFPRIDCLNAAPTPTPALSHGGVLLLVLAVAGLPFVLRRRLI